MLARESFPGASDQCRVAFHSLQGFSRFSPTLPIVPLPGMNSGIRMGIETHGAPRYVNRPGRKIARTRLRSATFPASHLPKFSPQDHSPPPETDGGHCGCLGSSPRAQLSGWGPPARCWGSLAVLNLQSFLKSKVILGQRALPRRSRRRRMPSGRRSVAPSSLTPHHRPAAPRDSVLVKKISRIPSAGSKYVSIPSCLYENGLECSKRSGASARFIGDAMGLRRNARSPPWPRGAPRYAPCGDWTHGRKSEK